MDEEKGAALFDAFLYCQWDLIPSLICPESANYRRVDQEYDSSILELFTTGGRSTEVQLLIQAKADVNSCNTQGETALHCACGNTKSKNMRLLLKASANVNARNQIGETPLMACADYGSVNLIRVLVRSGADLFLRRGKGRFINGETAKEIALLYPRSKKAAVLLERYEKQFIHCKSAQIAFCRVFFRFIVVVFWFLTW